MPILTTRDLASKLKQNWMEVNPADLLGTCNHHIASQPHIHQISKRDDSENLDDSLTSLNWLQNLRIMKIGQPTPPSSPTPLSVSNQQTHSLPTFTQKPYLNGIQKVNFTHDIKPIIRTPPQTFPVQLEPIDYKTNGSVKPPYSYATLIWMAMKESKKNKITLSAIYKWIIENFKYYQTAEPSWQNSIRHNLSLNKCFQKVARKKDEPGKGGFWRIDPAHAELLENGIMKKRRSSVLADPYPMLPKYIKLEPEDLSPSPSENNNEPEVEVEKPKPKKHKHHHSKKKHKSKQKKLKISALHSFNESFVEEDDNLPSSVLNESFKWDSIFGSEIDVGGTKVKTEHLLDSNGFQREITMLHNLTALNSPPHSDSNTEDITSPTQEVALDLSIKGTHIPKPLWFEVCNETEEAVTKIEESMEDLFGDLNLPPSPANSLDQSSHPWAENKEETGDFDFEDLLDFENLPNISDVYWEDNTIL